MTDPEVWLATRNATKEREFARILPARVRVASLASLEAARDFSVDEDAPDFAGNAAKKATQTAAFLRTRAAHNDALVLADDSGLCVDALDGAPGLASARWAGTGASDADRVAKLLAELDARPGSHRGARFVCACALATIDGRLLVELEEVCEGRIASEPRGHGGFGYDPVFVPAGTDKTFGELPPEEKDRLSHRGKALRRVVSAIASLLDDR